MGKTSRKQSPKGSTSGGPTSTDRRLVGEELWFRGSLLYDEGRHREAVKLFRRAARLGYDAAYGRLAIAFHDGMGVRRSPSIALHYYRRALAVGDTTALNNIGVLKREQGKLAEAAQWFQRSVDEGNDDALVQLAKVRIQQGGMTQEVRTQLRRVLKSNTCALVSQEEARALLGLPAHSVSRSKARR